MDNYDDREMVEDYTDSMDNYDDGEVVDDYTFCHTWLVEVCEPENVELVCPKLVLNIKTNITVLPSLEVDEEDNSMMLEEYENFCVNSCYEEGLELDLFTMDIHDATSSRAAIIDKLSSMYVPPQLHPSMAHKILRDVFSEARRHNAESQKVLHMKAMIYVCVVDSGEPDFDQGELAFVPASQSSIEKLERVRVETWTTSTSSVCMEELVVGSEATCMPCSHLSHEGCIVKWLQTSRFCPLCRFSMATDE